ncbi:MAG: hypothetical protein EXS10_04595 [Phycisphaerales bacterium]|nr:hypothetical protein [Phycisphaerales bacterium]
MNSRRAQTELQEQRNSLQSRWREFARRFPAVAFGAPAGVVAIVVILIALNASEFDPVRAQGNRLDGATEILRPDAPTDAELKRSSSNIGEQASVQLSDGAWIQVADDDGRLAQQYSAQRLEPLPASQIALTEPRVMMFLRDGRVIMLESRTGVAAVPQRALNSGTFQGDVVVHLFRPQAGMSVDPGRDAPAITIEADEAHFDNVLGEVRCDRAVRVTTEMGTFAGEGLSLVMDGEGDGGGLERLVVERATEPIRIDRAARMLTSRRDAAPTAAVPTTTPSNAVVIAPTQTPAVAPAPLPPAILAPAAVQPPAPPTEVGRVYQLVLESGVEIVRTKAGTRSTIKGDELLAFFTLDSNAMDSSSTSARSAEQTPSTPAFLHPSTAISAMTLAQVTASSDDTVTVMFGGRLVMTPAKGVTLESNDDIQFEVVGRRVECYDAGTQTELVCKSLRYALVSERIEAIGDATQPLRVRSPRMSLDGERFWMSQKSKAGRLEGPGRLRFARPASSSAHAAPLSNDASMHTAFLWLGQVPNLLCMIASTDPSAVALVQTAIVAPPTPTFDHAAQQLEIQWNGGVDLSFAGSADEPRLSGAKFVGGVAVKGREFTLDSGILDVRFDANREEQIELIIADEGAVVKRHTGGGLTSRRVELFLAQAKNGNAIPLRLVALGAIEATDARQTIWAESLDVSFAEKLIAVASSPNAAQSVDGLGADMGDVEVTAFAANQGVEVLLKEGARVYADVLEGNAAQRTLRLAGSDVAFVRGTVIADGLKEVRFDDATRTAHSDGPGRFRAFKEPIVTNTGRAPRPAADGKSAMEARWSESLQYTEDDPSKATLELRGGVNVRSKPSGERSDAIDADALLLELRSKEETRPDAKGRALPSGDRAVEHVVAKGTARLESRTWLDAAHSGDPRVFRVTGQHIEYDLRTREGLVVGDGTLLVNIPTRAASEPVVHSPNAAASGIALGADGTTRFRWAKRMELRHQFDDRFIVTMDDGVEVLHAGIRAEDTLSLRSTVLEAVMHRPQATADAAASDATKEDGVDLGGPAQLLSIKATGQVFVRTPQYDIECEEFDYSVETGVARLRAREGRMVTILTSESPTPIRAESVVWDLRNGRLTVQRASGGAAR